jgi:hypothetical protein
MALKLTRNSEWSFSRRKGKRGKTRYDCIKGYGFINTIGYGNKPWGKLASSEFGWRAQRKAHLFDVLASDRETDGYITKGREE